MAVNISPIFWLVMNKKHCLWFAGLLLYGLILTSAFSAVPKATPLEISDFTELPKAAVIDHYLDELADASPYATTKTLGYSAGGRPINALFVSKESAFLVGHQATGNQLTVMIIGSQHGNEPSGSEAIQVIAKRILNDDLMYFLDDVNLILIPTANPDGRDNNRRFNEGKVDLNRDYVTLFFNETQMFVGDKLSFQHHSFPALAIRRPIIFGFIGYCSNLFVILDYFLNKCLNTQSLFFDSYFYVTWRWIIPGLKIGFILY